jgi:guanosine-3',5'-bis(diphosphate) 3'-pyrophosphohydrolase
LETWEFCVQHHEGQKRASGEPYIIHPLEVAEGAGRDEAGLDRHRRRPAARRRRRHAVTTRRDRQAFGEQVAHIVEGVTKIDKIKFANREDRQAENVRKMLLAMVTDVRVVLIKLADRLHNMRTLEHLKPRSSRRSRARRWISTLRWRTGWAWARCAASSKTWPSATPIP